MVSVIENPIKDEAKDDLVLLQPITHNETFIATETLYNFLLQFGNIILELLNAIKKVRD